MKDSRNFKKWESQARQFFGDEFWNDILSVVPGPQGMPGSEGSSPEEAAERGNRSPNATHAAIRQPAVDVYKTEKQVIVHVELPGLSNISAVDLYMQNGQLVVSGHLTRRFNRDQTVQAERFIGDFKRVIALPTAIEEEGIQARYLNGILEITLPRLRKKREAPPYRIPIRREEPDL